MARSLSLALAVLALCSAVPAFAGEAYPELDLFIVDPSIVAEYDAAALDGSPPAYYFTKASDPALASTWVLYFKGGGWSYDELESYERSKGELGSSKNLAKTFKFEAGPSSPIPEYNSLAGANRVVLWYLDGMSFSGNREGNVPVPGTNETIRCRGFANLQAILKELDTMHGMSDASKVLVSGGSAGGLAAYLHSQYISDRYSRAMVAAAPASGFFLDHRNAAGDYVYPRQIKYAMTFQNATGGVNQRCVSAMPSGDEWKCGMAQFSWAHTEVPTFIMNCPWDSWQLGCEFTTVLDPQANDPVRASCKGLPGYEACGKDYNQCNSTQMGQFNEYASSMLSTMKSTPKFSQAGNGAFLHSCVSHVASQGTAFTSIKIDGVSFKEAFDAWWGAVAAGKPAPAEEHTHLPCTLHTEHPYACNPTC